MPSCFEIVASTGSYSVEIGEGLLASELARGGEQIVLADAFFAGEYRAGNEPPIEITAEEVAKSLDQMPPVITAMRERGVHRGTTLIAIGGGVVQDIAAFAASIYMRGLEWVYVPTTLLSMTDSCIGGKSSINVGPYKNLVGTFQPPRRVVIDTAVCVTLDAEQRAAGLCEAVKICLCRSLDVFDRYMALEPSVDADTATLMAVVDESLRAKKWFIEIDEFDRAERLVLNFGHTFGHAIESASRFEISHGIGVGLGMLAALELGELLGRRYDLPQMARFRAHVAELVGSVPTMPAALAAIDIDEFLDAFRSDKKHRRDYFAVIIVAEDGRVERQELPRDAGTEAQIANAFERMRGRWSGGERLVA